MQATLNGINIFLEYITWLKSLDFHVEYVQENNGSISGHVKELCTIDNASTRKECENKLTSNMREISEIFVNNFEFWASGRPFEVPYVLKVLYSTDEELKSCLHGEI